MCVWFRFTLWVFGALFIIAPLGLEVRANGAGPGASWNRNPDEFRQLQLPDRADVRFWSVERLRADAILVQARVQLQIGVNVFIPKADEGFFLVDGKEQLGQRLRGRSMIKGLHDVSGNQIRAALLSMVIDSLLPVMSHDRAWQAVSDVNQAAMVYVLDRNVSAMDSDLFILHQRSGQTSVDEVNQITSGLMIQAAVNDAVFTDALYLQSWASVSRPDASSDFYGRYLHAYRMSLPTWMREQLGRASLGVMIQGRYRDVSYANHVGVDAFLLNHRDDLHKSFELSMQRGSWNFYSSLGGDQSRVWGADDGAMVYLEAGGVRRVWRDRLDLYGMYRMNMNPRDGNPYPLSLEEERELLRFGARYYLYNRGGPHATVDLIYFFDNPIQGITDFSGEGIGIRAGFQYLF